MTPKQQRFIDEYLIDLNATQAAIRAGYSPKTAYSIGEENLRKPEITHAIDQAKAERLERNKVDADEILIHLSAAMHAKISEIRNDDGSFKPLSQWPDIWQQLANGGDVDVEDLMERSHDDVQAGESKSWDKIGTVTKTKHRFVDRAKIIELLMRHTQVNAMAQPKEEHSHIHVHIEVENRLARARQVAAAQPINHVQRPHPPRAN